MSAAPVVLLPVGEARQAIVRMIRQHNAVILVGETGSGKSTQVPQYVWDDILSLNQPVHSTPTPTREPRKDCASHTGGKDTNQNKNIHSIQNGGSSSPAVHHGNAYEGASIVGCTQPRRVAAVSIARHVAHLRGGSVGEEVGYAIRFDDTCTPRTRIKYMTDGILLREIQADKELRHYGCILLDEAHERTLHGDVLFGLLKDIARQRRHTLKIVVMSATLNAEQFSKFWWNAPIGVVHGRTYPVTIMHTVEPQVDYVEATVSTVLQIHHKEPAGDVLCFLTGQEEIEDAKRILEQRMRLMPHDVPDFSILTLYSAMPYEQQLRIFEPTETGRRKVILATNIAETSITVEGIKYVVDCGVVKAKYFNSKTGMEALTEVDVSRAQATQRAGRAGRMTAGKCFRLYPSSAFEALQETTTPEIRRSSLMSVVLQMKSLEIDRIMDFEFMDMPEARAVVKAEETLMLLRALDRHGRITPLGRRLTDFAVDPMAAMCLLAGKALRVAQDVCVVVAMTHTENIFLASRESKEGVDRCRAQFAKAAGDHATVLHMYRSYRRVPKAERRVWCETNSLNDRQMLKAEDVVTQLMATLASQSDDALMTQLLASLPSTATHRRDAESDGHADEQQAVCGHVAKRTRDEDADAGAGAGATEGEGVVAQLGQSLRRHQHMLDYELVRRALCFGYFLNAAFFNAKLGMYQTIVGQVPVHVHPSSVLFTHRRKPPLVIYNNIVRTTRRYMKDLSIVHEEWLQEAAHSFFRRLG